MNLNTLQNYFIQCNEEQIEPSFIGLNSYDNQKHREVLNYHLRAEKIVKNLNRIQFDINDNGISGEIIVDMPKDGNGCNLMPDIYISDVVIDGQEFGEGIRYPIHILNDCSFFSFPKNIVYSTLTMTQASRREEIDKLYRIKLSDEITQDILKSINKL